MLKKFARVIPLVAALLAAACGTVATPEWSEEAEGTRTALNATAEQQTASAPTAAPTSTLTPSPIPTEPPTATAVPPTEAPTTVPPTATAEATSEAPAANAAPPAGDAANGQVLFNELKAEAGFACSTCHFPNQEAQLIGPGLLNVSVRAETRVPGETAYDYIHTSIVNPSAHVVEGFPDNLMPKIYAEIFTEEQINDIIAYLYTLKS